MAVLWSLATLGCGLAENYNQMFLARFLVGVGEAAYGSVGIAVVLSVFPRHLRATLTGAFMAGGMFGSVLGIALGGAIAAAIGWRWAFGSMALFGLVLSAICFVVVRETRGPARPGAVRTPLKSLFKGRALCVTYVASGLQLFAGGACIVWMPSFMARFYGLGPDKAGASAALVVLASGAGMVFAAGGSGPAGAIVADLSPLAIHGTAFATLTLANNLLGLAPGPFLTGLMADHIGLDKAFQVLPLASLLSVGLFLYVYRHYANDAVQAARDHA
jgi:MFS family permease